MTVQTLGSVAAICLLACGLSTTSGAAGQPDVSRFEGLLNPSFKWTDGRRTPVFLDVTVSDIVPPGNPTVSSDELLKSLSADGLELKLALEASQAVYEFSPPKISRRSDNKPVDAFAVVVVFPIAGTKTKGEFKKAATFSPARLTTLTEVVGAAGPASKQLWSSKDLQDIALDGVVHWWGELGVAASPDDKISHVLLRALVKKK